MLSFAGRHADIVSINVNLAAGTGGAETAPNATPERTREKIAWVREAAGDAVRRARAQRRSSAS